MAIAWLYNSMYYDSVKSPTRTDDVTSAGVKSLGVMSVIDRSGATPDTGNLLAIKIIRTHRGGQDTRFCVGI